jgi:hypothetical protein
VLILNITDTCLFVRGSSRRGKHMDLGYSVVQFDAVGVSIEGFSGNYCKRFQDREHQGRLEESAIIQHQTDLAAKGPGAEVEACCYTPL